MKAISDTEKYLFKEGTWGFAFDALGAHKFNLNGENGYFFKLWCPDVKSVSLVGDFNNWDTGANMMECDCETNIWSTFITNIESGGLYKYFIVTHDGNSFYKADPFAFYAQRPPETASRVFDIDNFSWSDEKYLKERSKINKLSSPLNIYEVHLGSWKKRNNNQEYLTYDELSNDLLNYVKEMGYTHIEIMPIMEHPYDGSWGYQITGYFAPTSRYGNPKEFMSFINKAHEMGIGIILDWSPGHFCLDSHGLASFNGKKLYESEYHPNWGTAKFDLSKGEVRSFLYSNAVYWISKYHVDGIRVDGVTSMLYLNFGIDDPKLKKFNEKGTEENFVAIEFLRFLNTQLGISFPDVLLIAEESTAWPLVTYPPDVGGLGYNFKWDMGFMHDTLNYMKSDFPYRPGVHRFLTFSMMYNFNENFILSFSHDEVVHGKASIIGRMPGDNWRQFAGVRSLLFYQMTHPGGKLNFMGYEFGQFIEWRYYEGLEFFLAESFETHKKLLEFTKDLNHLYLKEKALWEIGFDEKTFEWIDANNNNQCSVCYVRHSKSEDDDLVIFINFVPEVYDEFRIGLPSGGTWEEIFNSDDEKYGGSGRCNKGPLVAQEKESHGRKYSIEIKTPPIGGLILKRSSKKNVITK